MKKIILLLLTFSFLFGCSEDKKDTKPDTPAETKIIKEIGPQKLLSYKYNKGDVLRYKLTTIQSNSQSIDADTSLSAEMDQTTTYILELSVNDIDDNMTADISLKVTSIIVDAIINGQKMTYDSKYIYSSRERKMFVDYESLKNKTFKIRVTKFGGIVDIYGVDDIVNEMLGIQGRTDLNEEQKKLLEQNLILSGISPLTEQIFRSTTNQEVGINSTWDMKYPSVFAGFEIENKITYNLSDYEEEDEDTLAKLLVNLGIRWQGKNQISEKGVKYTFSDPNVTGFGTVYFNINKGYVQRSETTVRMEMEVTMESFDSNRKPVKAYKREFFENKNIIEII